MGVMGMAWSKDIHRVSMKSALQRKKLLL